MQSLMHACIFSTSNPRGQRTFFAPYVLSGNSLSFGSFFFIIFSNFSNALSRIPFSAFHCSNSSVVPSFMLLAFRKLGTTIFCDPLTSGPTSTSQCYSCFLYVYHQWPDEDHLVMPLHLLVVPLHLQ